MMTMPETSSALSVQVPTAVHGPMRPRRTGRWVEVVREPASPEASSEGWRHRRSSGGIHPRM